MRYGGIFDVCTPRTYAQSVKKPIETCNTLRGTSCLWMKARKCLCIGIKPSGEGERENSAHVHPAAEPLVLPFVLAGERPEVSWYGKPFNSLRDSGLRRRTGERDFGRGFRPVARSIEDSEDSASARTSSCIGFGTDAVFRADALVVGPS